jgi:hypothetical protein
VDTPPILYSISFTPLRTRTPGGGPKSGALPCVGFPELGEAKLSRLGIGRAGEGEGDEELKEDAGVRGEAEVMEGVGGLAKRAARLADGGLSREGLLSILDMERDRSGGIVALL